MYKRHLTLIFKLIGLSNSLSTVFGFLQARNLISNSKGRTRREFWERTEKNRTYPGCCDSQSCLQMFISEACSLFCVFHLTEQLFTNVCTLKYRKSKKCPFSYSTTFLLRYTLETEVKDWRVAEFILWHGVTMQICKLQSQTWYSTVNVHGKWGTKHLH
jgi:hypothetical protein